MPSTELTILLRTLPNKIISHQLVIAHGQVVVQLI